MSESGGGPGGGGGGTGGPGGEGWEVVARRGGGAREPAEHAQDVLSKPSSDVSEGPLAADRVRALVEQLYGNNVSYVQFPEKSERVARAELASQLGFRETEVAGHEEKTTSFTFKFDTSSSLVQPEYIVGGGGGHRNE